MNKNNWNELILIKSIYLVNNDNCAILLCNQFVLDEYISKLRSYIINKDKYSLLDYGNHEHHCNIKVYIKISNELLNDEILLCTDIGINEYLLKIK
jgi:hypothetical protein